MKTKVQQISKYDIRATYYGDNGRVKLLKTARAWAAFYFRKRVLASF
jgi:hypothetical protein